MSEIQEHRPRRRLLMTRAAATILIQQAIDALDALEDTDGDMDAEDEVLLGARGDGQVGDATDAEDNGDAEAGCEDEGIDDDAQEDRCDDEPSRNAPVTETLLGHAAPMPQPGPASEPFVQLLLSDGPPAGYVLVRALPGQVVLR